MTDGANMDVARLEFEREKWAADVRLRERELDLRQSELELKRADQRQSRWRSPLIVAIFAAALAAAGNAGVALVNGIYQRDLEDRKATAEITVEESKAESNRILEMIKTGDPESAANNLQFLVDSGLITDKTRVSKLTEYLANRPQGSGAALPAAAGGIQFEPSKELTQPLKETLEADLKAYMAYLTEIGLAGDLPVIKIKIEPIFKDGMISYYVPGDNIMVVDVQAAPDPYVPRREATHHALTSDDPAGCQSNGCMTIESGLADYFPASFADSPRLGDKLAKVYGIKDPFYLNIENDKPFASIKLDDLAAVYKSGEVWSGAFWAIRSKLGKEAADSIFSDAWNATDRSLDDPAKAFVAAIMAAAKDDGADSLEVAKILQHRGFPVPQ